MERPEPSVRALIASLLSLAFSTSLARASDLPLALEWEAPELCGSRARVLEEVASIVGQVDAGEGASVRARATVTPLEDGGFQVVLVTEVNGSSGERTLVGRDCDEVRRSTSLILALMINPDASLDAPQKAPEPAEPEPEPEAAPVEMPDPGATPEAARTAPAPADRAMGSSAQDSRYLLGAGAIGGIGTLPKASIGVELRLGLSFGGFVVEVQGAGWLRRSEQAKTPPGAGGEFGLLGANLLAGYRTPPWAGGELRLAVGLAGRRMRATGFGVSEPGSATGYWAGALGELSLAQRVSHSAWLRLRGGAELPFERPRFAIRGATVVHEVGAVGGFVALGLELQF